MAMRTLVGKVLYGALFLGVLPVLLLLWAQSAAPIVNIPMLRSLPMGLGLTVAGAFLMVWGWASLLVFGRGLPMNAFPPTRHVTQGAYRVVSHPIYVGFSMIVFGVSIAAGSSSGFWLVSPTVVLGCSALVLGYERLDLRARFGKFHARPWLSLPNDDPTPPTLQERLSLYPMVVLPGAAIEAAIAGVSTAPSLRLAFVIAAPLVARTRADLRHLALGALLAMGLSFPVALAFPLVSPALLVACIFLASDAWASRVPRELSLASLILLLQVEPPVGVVVGCVAYGAVARAGSLWAGIRRAAEWIANSWKEWRIGPMRLINHGGYAALASFGGLVIVGTVLGPDHAASVLIAALTGLVGAGLWAQWVEGSPALLRPYGFYGGLIGIIAGSLAAPLTGTKALPLLAAYCVAGPWVQAVGRLRCLVQGCCHGRDAPEGVGIRYLHPRSRVVRLSDLGGRPVHPTQVYSILWNGVIALTMVCLVRLHFPAHFICGTYLILSGLGRFVEESYRGEPQTPVRLGLPIYQWAAVSTVILGAILTVIPSKQCLGEPQPNAVSVILAGLFAFVTWFALGVDFPESNRRFSRLA